jgi:putative membrane protein insertion efficiency factor
MTSAERADAVLRFYQRWISPPLHAVAGVFGVVPAGCRYLPTCSDYAREALARHGLVRGGWLSLRRLSRCHPLARRPAAGSFDPVP